MSIDSSTKSRNDLARSNQLLPLLAGWYAVSVPTSLQLHYGYPEFLQDSEGAHPYRPCQGRFCGQPGARPPLLVGRHLIKCRNGRRR